MCWPRFEGGLEIEERYPRTNNPREPRRKRLNFVKDRSHSRSSSDDYALMRSSFVNARPIRAEMQERHDPRMLLQQEQQMRMLHGQNQQLHGQNQQLHHQLQQIDMQRRHEIEQAPHYGHPPPPPPPPHAIGHHSHEQARLQQHPHHDYADEEWRPAPQVIEIQPRPRSRMPEYVQHGRGRDLSRGRSHRRHHSGASVYSDDHDSYRDYRRRQRSPIVYGSSHDSFDDLIPTHNPHIQRIVNRRR
ncbi:MAG: hypothetical protein Q9222_002745 [Ikaeria aurantiellina]